ncbi:MAG: aminopeptidase [Thermoplasmata archaeon]
MLRKTRADGVEKLELKREPAWDHFSKKEKKAAEALSGEYRAFLDAAKTEREAVAAIRKFAQESGFTPIDSARSARPGERLYFIWKNKCAALAVVGEQPPSRGLNIIASHIDSPRLDLKQNPLHEESETRIALFRTHYYGGIKKYQWATIPLALHGRVVLRDGREVDVSIGEDEGDPVFTIEDLAPHLYRQSQAKRHLEEGLKGEELHAIVATNPIDGHRKAKSRTKLLVLDILHRRYGMMEEDFASAELELVPAGRSREVGLDRSLVLGYGQDDRVCAFAALSAIRSLGRPRRTCAALFFDKEEIGSEGNTSARSRLLASFTARLIELTEGDAPESALRRALERSSALSADTTSALDPIFKDAHEPSNAARLGFGVVLTKFTGSGGKYQSSDASAEYVGAIRRLLNAARIPWQSAELGKVDEGGGGTIAKFLAEHGMDVVDLGPCVLSLHAPMELTSKADLFCAVRAYTSFFEAFGEGR